MATPSSAQVFPRSRKRDEVWRGDAVARECARVLEERRALLRDHGVDALLAAAVRVSRARPGTRFEDELTRFAVMHASLTLLAEEPAFARASAQAATCAPRCFRIATRVLHAAGVRTRGSRLSHLHDDLRRRLSLASAALGEGTRQTWKRELGRTASDPPSPGLFVLADRRLEELGAADARLALLEAELDHATDADRFSLRLARARTLRFSGLFEEADTLLQGLDETWPSGQGRGGGARSSGASTDHATTPSAANRVGEERADLLAMRSGELDAPIALLRKTATSREPRRQLVLWIWSRAVTSKAWQGHLPKASSLARQLRGATEVLPLVRAAMALERAYRSSLPLDARIHAIGKTIDEFDEVEDLGAKLLILGAAARWLSRAKQPDLAAIPASLYETLCLSLSDGRSADLFRLTLPIRADADSGSTRPSSIPPSGVFDRTEAPRAGLSRDLAFGQLGLSLFKARAGALFRPSDADRLTEYAEALAYHFSVLKGPVMKMGQILSYYGFDLPAEAEAALGSLQDSASAVPFEIVRRVVEAELGRPLEEVFRRFDERACASGSIGQVHVAELTTGERVAVKVQYPGIEDCVRRDFRSLKLLLPLVRPLLAGWDLDGIVDELRARMLEECDYVQEAEAQSAFRERLADDAEIVIPRVFPALSTTRVLVTEYFEGERFAEFAECAPQAARDRAAATVIRYVVRSTIGESYFNSDMHPGNLLFADGRVCFLDFGNVRRWPNGEGACWGVILHGLLHREHATVERGLRMAGLIEAGSEVDVTSLIDAIATHLMRAVVEDRAQRIDKRVLMQEMRRFVPDAELASQRMKIPPIHIYGFRIYWGMFAVVADLRSEINSRRVVLSVLDRRPPPC